MELRRIGASGLLGRARRGPVRGEGGSRGGVTSPERGTWPRCGSFWSELHFPAATASTGRAAPLCPPEAEELLSGPAGAGFHQTRGRRWARMEVARAFGAGAGSSRSSALQVGSGLSGLWVTRTSASGPSAVTVLVPYCQTVHRICLNTSCLCNCGCE